MKDDEKVRVNVYIPKSLYKQAKKMGIKLSQTLEQALIVEIAIRKRYIKEFRKKYALMSLGKGNVFEENDEFDWDDDSGLWDDESGAP